MGGGSGAESSGANGEGSGGSGGGSGSGSGGVGGGSGGSGGGAGALAQSLSRAESDVVPSEPGEGTGTGWAYDAHSSSVIKLSNGMVSLSLPRSIPRPL